MTRVIDDLKFSKPFVALRKLMPVLMLALLLALPSQAAIFGVPTNLDAAGATTASSVNPPGWFTYMGPTATDSNEDVTHNIRFMIEVTGTTLDVLVFDPGTGGARDYTTPGTVNATSFTLFNPSGTSLSSTTGFGADNATTDNHLVRFTPASAGFFALNSANASNVSFSGLSAGLYEFRVQQTSGNEGNAFGVEFLTAKGSTTHYNAYVLDNGNAAGATSSSLAFGYILTTPTAPSAAATGPSTFYAYVDRGCSMQTLNYDGDVATITGVSGAMIDAQGTSNTLTMSGATVHTQNSLTVENVANTNILINNQGMWRYEIFAGTSGAGNLITSRTTDYNGWSDALAAKPLQSNRYILQYLPNGYTPTATSAAAVAPIKQFMNASATYVSGANPPVSGSSTVFSIAISVKNPTGGSALTSVQMTSGLPAGVTFVAASNASFINGVSSPCTDASVAGSYRRCTFATVNAGETATMRYNVTITPAASGLLNLLGAPTLSSTVPPANTVTWAQMTPASSSVTFPRTEYVGPVCQLVVNVGAAGALTLDATVASIKKVSPNQLQLITSTQNNTAGFNIYESSDPRGKSDLNTMNRSLVLSEQPDSTGPLAYNIPIVSLGKPWLFVEEIETDGHKKMYGPFSAQSTQSTPLSPVLGANRFAVRTAPQQPMPMNISNSSIDKDALGQFLRMLAGNVPLLKNEQFHPFIPFDAHEGRALKIEVGSPGLVELPLSTLRQNGLPSYVPLQALRLYSHGKAWPFSRTANSIKFQAQGLATTYTGTEAYVLEWSDVPPRQMVSLTVEQSPLPLRGERVQKDLIYVPSAAQGTDPWYWALLRSDVAWPPYDKPELGTFDFQGRIPGGMQMPRLSMELMGRSAHSHEVTAILNGVAVGSVHFDGAVKATLSAVIPNNLLKASGNKLQLQYQAAGAASGQGFVYLNHLDFTNLALFGNPNAVVTRIVPYKPSLPSFHHIDTLILTHRDFVESANDLAALKTQEGKQVAVVDVERAYDLYSGGIVEVNAIHRLIQQASATSGRLQTVVLVGDDTFDARDNLKTGAKAFIPSPVSWDGSFGRIPSENQLADLDGDGKPELAIGRLPVQTAADAQILINKIASQSGQMCLTAGKHLVAVDQPGPSDDAFGTHALALSTYLGSAQNVQWSDVSQDPIGARSSLFQGWNSGVSAVHYIGHGSPTSLSAENLLRGSDALSLGGSSSVLFSWACLSQWYQYLYGPSLGESMLLTPNGGALATIGPTGISTPGAQEIFRSLLYPKLFQQHLSLGQAMKLAKREAIELDPQLRSVVDNIVLLGDPDLTFQAPAGDVSDGVSDGENTL